MQGAGNQDFTRAEDFHRDGKETRDNRPHREVYGGLLGGGEVMTPEIYLFPHTAGRRRMSAHWFLCRDADDVVRGIFDRHYSRIHYADGRTPKHFVGPGEKMVLISEDETAIFVWRKFINGAGERGINCAVFRNEGPVLSSELILEASAVAWKRWPGERLYTYVNAGAIRSTNPGACFKKAGWRKCGVTKWNKLVILEKPQHAQPFLRGSATNLDGVKR